MKLTLESLREVGAFTGGPVRRDVEWIQNGEKVSAEVYVRPMSYQTAVRDITTVKGGGDIIAQRIAGCVCHEDGSPVFLVSDITGIGADGNPIMIKGDDGVLVERGPINKNLAEALILLVSEVSGLGKTKSSTTKANSGASSSSTELVAEPSRKRSKA